MSKRRILTEPIPNTCPDVDALIDEIIKLEGKVVTKNNVIQLSKGLEKLRKSNAKLRDWGTALTGKITGIQSALKGIEDYSAEVVKLRNSLEIRLR